MTKQCFIKRFSIFLIQNFIYYLQYPTPASLIEALNSCSSDVEREQLLNALKCPKTRRAAISSNLSCQLARLYSWKNLQ